MQNESNTAIEEAINPDIETTPVIKATKNPKEKSLGDIFSRNKINSIIPSSEPSEQKKVIEEKYKSHDDANQAAAETQNNTPVEHPRDNKAVQPDQQDFDRRLKESRQRFDDLSRKLSGVEKIVKDYANQGALTADEAQKILEQAEHEAISETQQSTVQTPWHLYTQVWDQELDNIRKYSNDPNIDQHVYAFQHFMANATQNELNQALSEFDPCKSDSIALTRKMLDLGKSYNDDIYGEYSQAGGLKNYKSQYEERLAKQQKTIDKLEKEILKLNNNSDYIPSQSYKLPSGSTKAGENKRDNSLTGIFDRRKFG